MERCFTSILKLIVMPTKGKLKFDSIPLDEMIDVLQGQIANAQEYYKTIRTSKSKRYARRLIEGFNDCFYLMKELKRFEEHETDIKNQ